MRLGFIVSPDLLTRGLSKHINIVRVKNYKLSILNEIQGTYGEGLSLKRLNNWPGL